MAADLGALIDDLVAESAVLRAVLEQLCPVQWSLATPAVGWSVGDHVSHLAYFDGATLHKAIHATFARRQTVLSDEPPYPLRDLFAEDETKQTQDTLGECQKAKEALIPFRAPASGSVFAGRFVFSQGRSVVKTALPRHHDVSDGCRVSGALAAIRANA